MLLALAFSIAAGVAYAGGDCGPVAGVSIVHKRSGGEFEIQYQAGFQRGDRCLRRDARSQCIAYDEKPQLAPGLLLTDKNPKAGPLGVITARREGTRKVQLQNGFTHAVPVFRQVKGCGVAPASGKYDAYTWLLDFDECKNTSPGTAALVMSQHQCKAGTSGGKLTLDCEHTGGVKSQFVYYASEDACKAALGGAGQP